MPDLSRFLRRFRRLVSPPGRPGPIAVPADRSAELSSELEAVFRAIDGIQEEAERIRKQSEDEARKKKEEAEEEAGRILSEAGDRAEQARAEEASRHREDIEQETRRALDEASKEAEQIRGRVDQKLDSVAERVVARLTGSEEARSG
jgi:vacuolar-type H+-ATPase subunit H